MLAVNTYPQSYIDSCRQRIQAQVASYQALRAAAQSNPQAIADFEAEFFNHLLLALDNLFCHRTRTLEKKDGNPLNEFRMICQSIMQNDSRLSVEKSIKYDAQNSVLKLAVGDKIRLSEADFIHLSEAFFAELASKFCEEMQVVG